MDETKCSEWFPAEIKPVHHGWYQVRQDDTDNDDGWQIAAHWNGVRWSSPIGLSMLERPEFIDIDGVSHRFTVRWKERRYSKFQCLGWRGLTAPAP